jgi:chaperonin GroEL (HSP60 family)
LAQLKKAHNEEDGIWKGLDLEKGVVVDTMSRIVEPVDVMLSILQSATEAAVMILRIDGNIFHAPRKPFIS